MWKALLLHICHLSIVGLFTMIHATCDLQPITGDDAQFCSDKFHVVYQGIGDVSCKHVPPCENYTQALSDAPALRYSNAEEDEVYTLIMVDPDAPSRQNPKFKNWRHWVLADIQGRDLLSGKTPKGGEITVYKGPTPPANTGYHRYQFLLYLQPSGSFPSIPSSEDKSRGNFDADEFASHFSLGRPVATTQFTAQNSQQKDTVSF
ncbi:phosphatidylethanolamine-binding protein 4 isoform X2 [Phyllobates terribilis]|uniref:phosphatidylethanolamine-binding protein 4 isoform X2 n=1 Tax=Phyllobates terribilis TaxID=111132 RepID=UPI003CCAE6CD